MRVAFFVISLLMAFSAYATNTKPSQNQHQIVDVVSKSGSSSVSSSVSNASNEGNTVEGSYGFGLGSAAFNECYRSYSILVFQGSQLNALCLANNLIAEGKYEEAARMRCHDGGVRKAITGRRFGKKARQMCVDALIAQDKETVKKLKSDIALLQNERRIERQKCNEAKNRITEGCYNK